MSEKSRERTVVFLSDPARWPLWPFLPVIRRRPGCEDQEGVMYDALHDANLPGHSCTVYLCNLMAIPPTRAEFLQLAKEVYDTPEVIADAGWVVD